MQKISVIVAAITAVAQVNAAQNQLQLSAFAEQRTVRDYRGNVSQINVVDVQQSGWNHGQQFTPFSAVFNALNDHYGQNQQAQNNQILLGRAEVQALISAISDAGMGLKGDREYVPYKNGFSANDKRVLLVYINDTKTYMNITKKSIIHCIRYANGQ